MGAGLLHFGAEDARTWEQGWPACWSALTSIPNSLLVPLAPLINKTVCRAGLWLSGGARVKQETLVPPPVLKIKKIDQGLDIVVSNPGTQESEA